MKGLVIAYGAGIATGVLVAWEAARRWERTALSWSWTSAMLAETGWLLRQAAGWIVGVVLLLVAAGAVVWIAL